MSEIHILQIVGQLVGKLSVGEPAIILVRNSHPGAKVYFIYRYWRVQRALARACFHPFGIVPLVRIDIEFQTDAVRRLTYEMRNRRDPIFLSMHAGYQSR